MIYYFLQLCRLNGLREVSGSFMLAQDSPEQRLPGLSGPWLGSARHHFHHIPLLKAAPTFESTQRDESSGTMFASLCCCHAADEDPTGYITWTGELAFSAQQPELHTETMPTSQHGRAGQGNNEHTACIWVTGAPLT